MAGWGLQLVLGRKRVDVPVALEPKCAREAEGVISRPVHSLHCRCGHGWDLVGQKCNKVSSDDLTVITDKKKMDSIEFLRLLSHL